jgi:hypothetical protein
MFFGLNDVGFLGSLQPPSTLLLDLYPNAAAAYSLRQLRAGVANVVRVRRSSDNTEQDFTAAQVTDGTLTTFCGAGNGFVRTWYDQSGNGRNATQATTANQPQIVSSGALLQTNSKPALDFNGTSQRFDIPTIAFNMNALSVNIVSKSDTSTGRIAFASPDPNRLYAPFLSSGIYYAGYATEATAFNFGSSSLTSQYLVQLNAGSSTVNAWRNGTASTAVSSNSAAEAGSNLSLGSYKNDNSLTSFWDGTIQELFFYTSDQTSNQSGIASNINAHYAIY